MHIHIQGVIHEYRYSPFLDAASLACIYHLPLTLANRNAIPWWTTRYTTRYIVPLRSLVPMDAASVQVSTPTARWGTKLLTFTVIILNPGRRTSFNHFTSWFTSLPYFLNREAYWALQPAGGRWMSRSSRYIVPNSKTTLARESLRALILNFFLRRDILLFNERLCHNSPEYLLSVEAYYTWKLRSISLSHNFKNTTDALLSFVACPLSTKTRYSNLALVTIHILSLPESYLSNNWHARCTHYKHHP